MNAQHWEGPPPEHLSGICPNCNLPSTFERRGEVRLTASDGERWMHNPKAANVSMTRGVAYQCRACFNGCLAVEQIDPSRDEVAYKGVHWWPPQARQRLTCPSRPISPKLSGRGCVVLAPPLPTQPP
jgi:hypothetical protein